MSDDIKEIISYLKKKENTRNIKCITLSERDKLLNYITNLQQENDRLNNIINELERRFNQELELNNKWEVEDTQKFYSKKWYRDVLRDFKNMIKELKENK